MALWLAAAAQPAVPPARAQFAITEFMASNTRTLKDDEGNYSDWIEIHNEGKTTNNLGGWHLSDAASQLTQWQFPPTNLPPNAYLVVFASGKNRRVPGAPLHTNFKLSSGGEYLALVNPDGAAIATEFRPAFPPQAADVSFGLVRQTSPVTILPAGVPARAFVPQDPTLGLDWTMVEFDDSRWPNGATGIGYDRQTIGVNLLPLIGLNVESMMYNASSTLYIRVPFAVEDPSQFIGLTLRVQFQDGFIAWLNSAEAASTNDPPVAAWNSAATAPRTKTAATNYMDFDLTDSLGFLMAGTNVLAFQALNAVSNRQQLLLLPQLIGLSPNGPPVARYFPVPTPGQPNNDGVPTIGPVISESAHSPLQPGTNDPVLVTARIRPALAPIGPVQLRYRVMFGSEVKLPMFDDGAHGDAAASDGVYGATIPARVAGGGQMLRWYISATDTNGTNVSRFPPFTDTNNSPAYFGVVIPNPALTNPLPVFHWFVQNVAATDTRAGTRCSVYWDGEFYDNVFCRVRGATAASYAKKPYKFNFNRGEHFRWLPGLPRENQINLNTTFQDKAYVRAPLTFETYRQAGTPACDAFNVRVQQNGAFFSVAVLNEQVDETFLERRGLDPNGALYKLYNGITSSTSGVEKKTRLNENNADLQQLVDGLALRGTNRARFVFDNFDLPEIINYLAAGIVSQDFDRMIKNIYLYRDTEGTRLWTMYPWDKDLTFGVCALQCDQVTGNIDTDANAPCGNGAKSHPLVGTQARNFVGHVNNLFDAIYSTPITLEMFLRRLRTLMDELLQPPGTPAAQLLYERRLDEVSLLLQPDATLDLAKWRAGFGQVQNLATAMGILKTNYLAQRRVHLYQTHSIDNVRAYPAAAGIPHAQLGSPALAFGQIEFNPASANQAQEFIELLNPNPVAVDISGWQLGGGVTFTFAPGTVVPSNGHVYVSPDVLAFRTRATGPRGGQGLFIVGNYAGQLSARGETLTLCDTAGLAIAATNYAGNPSPAQQFLRITELMYHPAPLAGNTNAADEFEFLELANLSTNLTLDLRGVHFSQGLDFSFTGSAVTSLGPGQTVLVVKNAAAFAARYGAGFRIAGEYTGNLNNASEALRLDDAAGEKILEFTYDNNWHPITDGQSFSLVITQPAAPWDTWGMKESWRPSAALGGSPGAPDPPPPAIPTVLVNEVLSRTDSPPPTDSIELFNPAANAVDISGWFITDDFNTPRKFRIPNGTVIPGGGFVVFTEADFNPIPGVPPSFAFSSHGDQAWLFSADAQGNLTGYLHGLGFGAADNNVSFGRYLDSTGAEQFVAQRALSLGAPNPGPRVGPVVISEILYQPAAPAPNRLTILEILRGTTGDMEAGLDQFQYLELQNLAAHPVALCDPALPTNTWRLRGAVDFDFPAATVLAPGGLVLIVGFDPVAEVASRDEFLTHYGLTNALLLGPWSGQLAKTATLRLERPEPPEAGEVPYVLVEAVAYDHQPPWPDAADGSGASLQRRALAAFGNDPANWIAAPPSPGALNPFQAPPLALSLSAAGVLSWPAIPGKTVLQVTETLREPIPWREDLSARATNNGFYEVQVPQGARQLFYRVIQP